MHSAWWVLLLLSATLLVAHPSEWPVFLYCTEEGSHSDNAMPPSFDCALRQGLGHPMVTLSSDSSVKSTVYAEAPGMEKQALACSSYYSSIEKLPPLDGHAIVTCTLANGTAAAQYAILAPPHSTLLIFLFYHVVD
jgi:hypothetical protein